MRRINLAGKTFGRLTVIGNAPNRGRRTFVLCECKCGKTKEISKECLQRGTTISCGCHGRELIASRSLF